jgi:Family of unknown function (DUF6166)
MAERFYSGREDHVSIREGQQSLPLNARLDLDPEGQTVLKWGRANSKGKRLAISLLADALNDDRAAVDLAEAFTARVVAMLPGRWTMSRTRILSFVEIIKRESLGTPARQALNRASYDQARTDYGER